MGWVIGIFIAFCLFGMWMFTQTDKTNQLACKKMYGVQYQLEHSSVNSGIEWCEGPNGTMKAVPN